MERLADDKFVEQLQGAMIFLLVELCGLLVVLLLQRVQDFVCFKLLTRGALQQLFFRTFLDTFCTALPRFNLRRRLRLKVASELSRDWAAATVRALWRNE